MSWIIYGKHARLIWLMLGMLALGWPWAALSFGAVWLVITVLRWAMSGDDGDVFYSMTGRPFSDAAWGLQRALRSVCWLQIALAGAKVLDWTAQSWWWIMTPTIAYAVMAIAVALLTAIAAARRAIRRRKNV